MSTSDGVAPPLASSGGQAEAPAGDAGFAAELTRLANQVLSQLPGAGLAGGPATATAPSGLASGPQRLGPSALSFGAGGVSSSQTAPPTPGFAQALPIASAPPPKESDLRTAPALFSETFGFSAPLTPVTPAVATTGADSGAVPRFYFLDAVGVRDPASPGAQAATMPTTTGGAPTPPVSGAVPPEPAIASRRDRAVQSRARPRSRRQARDLRSGLDPARLPDPRGARPRTPPGLARQRRDDAEAARGHRSPHVLLRARELEHPPRRAHAGGARDRRLRGRARQGAPLPQRAVVAGDRLRARRDRGDQPRRAELGPAQHRRGRRDRHHAGSSTTPTSCPGSSSAPRRARASASRPVDIDGPDHPRGVREAARARARGSSRSRRSRTRSARSRRRARWSRWRTATARTVLVDGAQAVSHMPVDVQALDCDFYCFSGHKVFAPTGIGALYGKADVLEDMPPWQGGGNMIRDVTFERTTLPAAAVALRGGHGQHRRRGRARAPPSTT